ncbi:MAG: HTH-type transcriptional regulator HdfR [Plesiomonas sp.]|uniref:HTH-type transcriptional regulator HdfR n=1 Tax=Plesiomonas sp. TaxID=2486279 RepID=UPI003EE48A27
MDTELLKTFIVVSKTRHFGKAAESLFLTQSAVSFRIRQLETQLNVTLFNRNRNNIQLTPAGERLVPYASNLLQTWQQAQQDVSQSHQIAPLRIMASPCLWESVLGDFLHQISLQHPALPLHTEFGPSRTLLRQLLEQSVDLGFSFDQPRSDEFTTQPCAEISLQLFASSATQTQKNRTEHYHFIEWGSGFMQQQGAWFTPDIPPRLHSHSMQQVLHQLHQNKGCAFLPASMHAELGSLGLTAVNEIPPLPFTLYAIWPQNSPHDALIRSLLPLLTTNL